MENPRCPKCDSKTVKHAKDSKGRQRWHCKNERCGYRFVLRDEEVDVDSITETNEYANSNTENDLFKDYCKELNLPIEKVKSYKFVNHQGQKAFNIVFHEDEGVIDSESIKTRLEDYIRSIKPKFYKKHIVPQKECVVTITDLHFGAYIDNLIRSKPFSITVLTDMLERVAVITNSRNYNKVHIHILGDIIESFTGLNHSNTWKGLDKGMVGSSVVKLATKVLHENLLDNITNVGEVKIIGANHDRVTSNNDEDTQGEAADLIAWGLEMIGYSVEFNPLIITHEVQGINHILTHGNHGLNKQSTEEICWKYGKQGIFNFIKEGHLHTRIQKLTAKSKEKFKLIKDDTLDLRRQVMPSLFTGNFYSESNGWESNPGFTIIENNGNGKPNVFDYSL